MAQTQSAIKTVAGGKAIVSHDAPIPQLQDDFILAHPKAVSLNPTDYKHMERLTVPGATLGCDWSGVVIAVGKNVTRFKPGDEVSGVSHGGCNHNFSYGAYAQTITCAEMNTMHKPANLTFEEAATLGVGTLTIGQTMYFHGKLDKPSPENLGKTPTKDILIYGGSSATGTLAIQFAKLSGYRVLATSSPHNFELLRSLGADEVYSYTDPASTIPAIQKSTSNSLSFIYDCIGTEDTAAFCAPLLSPTAGGHYHSVSYPLKPAFKRLRPEDNVTASSALGYTMLGERFEVNGLPPFEVDPAEIEFARDWITVVERLVATGHVTPHPAEVMGTGLDDVLAAIYRLQEKGNPSGKKMVFRIE